MNKQGVLEFATELNGTGVKVYFDASTARWFAYTSGESSSEAGHLTSSDALTALYEILFEKFQART